MSEAQSIVELEARYLVQTYKRAPFVLERGEGVYLYDTEGRRYLDFVAGIAVNALGHGHPAVVRAIQEQAPRLIHVSNLYHTRPHVELARMLVESSFADRAWFCNSGTEAIEASLKFARKWAGTRHGPGKEAVVAFSNAFHGRTVGALSVTANPHYRQPFEPLMPGVRFARFNDLGSAREAVRQDVCAILVEPVQGEGGVHPASPEFLGGLAQLALEHEALLVFDEVQCGMGRTGKLWAHEWAGVEPDIMALAKPLGGGLPLGVVLCSEEVASVMAPGDHGSTFAAGPLVTGVGRAVLETVRQPAFLEHVRRMGELLGQGLRSLDSRQVREVRGAGLMWGVEVRGKAQDVLQAGYEEGVIMAAAGESVVRLVPPLIIEEEHVRAFLPAFERALKA